MSYFVYLSPVGKFGAVQETVISSVDVCLVITFSGIPAPLLDTAVLVTTSEGALSSPSELIARTRY